ncbi:MAG: CRISPR-associated endonuclease Cas1 [Actinobacteria bacterium]|nr:CRISPR-associated endonuclease Cas1 [Actinomycetota bacterium]
MQLVINTPGSYLRRKEGNLFIKNDGQVFEVSVKKVSSILITTAATISTDAVKLAIDHNVDLIFLDHFGDPYGRIWHSKLGSTTLIRRRQLEVAEKEEGLTLALEWVGNKFRNQIDLLTGLRATRSRRSAEITAFIERLRAIQAKLSDVSGKVDEARQLILGVEGVGSRLYFEAISELMPERYRFNGRSRNPAKDEFNCLLNYAYGVLYSMVEKACILAGLDPYVGIIHTDHYNKKSMVFDLIENYRVWADETVIKLFAGRQVKVEHFDKLENGFTLNKLGKALLIEALNKWLAESVRYRRRNIKRADIIQFDCHQIANDLIKRAPVKLSP